MTDSTDKKDGDTTVNDKKEEKRSGICLVKPEFIIEESVRSSNSVESTECKENGQVKNESNEPANESEEPPQKKFKNNHKKDKPRGQNKKRSVPFQITRQINLCPWIAESTVEEADKTKCPNKNCVFLHDRAEYLKIKPEDIGTECYTFELRGKCQRGAACRVGSKHVTPDGYNIVNKEKYEAYQKLSPPVKNQIDKEIVEKLRKYKYDFTRAEQVAKKYNWKISKKLDEAKETSKDESENTDGKDKSEITDGKNNSENTNGKNESENINSKNEFENTNDKNESENTNGKNEFENTNGKNESENTDGKSVDGGEKKVGAILDEEEIKLRPSEKKRIEWRDKVMLAPLTTVGNLPFRRICKEYGADITCGEMTLAPKLLKGTREEWALVKRHESEDLFGVQVAGSNPGVLARCVQLLNQETEVDFVDLNIACPIDLVYNTGAGCGMMNRLNILESVVKSASELLDVPFTIKTRTGVYADKPVARELMPKFRDWGAQMVNIHGRSREQRYTKLADWQYIEECAQAADPMPVFGTGDILSYDDYLRCRTSYPHVSGVSIARGALIKPWIFQEIKERKLIDISSSERFDMMRRYTKYGLEHWGSDTRGVETTRRFLLEWISFLYRYVPVGLLVEPPQRMNNRPPYYRGRDDMETLMASANCTDWIKLSEMLLGKVPDGFNFLPKHKANSWK